MEAESRADPGRSAAFRWYRWFANPLTRLGLRTPIVRRLLGRSLLTVRGSRTGNDFTFPVMYALDGDDIVVVPGRPEIKTWWRNLRDPAEVRVRLAGREFEAKARAIEGTEDPGAVAEGWSPGCSAFRGRLAR